MADEQAMLINEEDINALEVLFLLTNCSSSSDMALFT